MGLMVSANMAVDPGGELGDPGVDSRQVWSAAAGPPAHNPYEEPATPVWGLAGQRTSWIPLGNKKRLFKNLQDE